MKQTLDNELHSIEIPASLHDRCAQGVRMAAQTHRRIHMKRLTAVAAAAVCVLTLSLPSIADGIRGFFSDIIRWDGAITGTAYTPGEDEILLSVSDGTLEIAFGLPEEIPFRLLEHLRIDACILSSDGSETLFTGEAEIIGGTAKFPLPNLPDGSYTLTVDSLKGLSKADAPLEIRKVWNVTFDIP